MTRAIWTAAFFAFCASGALADKPGPSFASLGLETDVAALRDRFPSSTQYLYQQWSLVYSKNPKCIGPDGRRHPIACFLQRLVNLGIETGSLSLKGETRYDLTFAPEEDPGHVHWAEFQLVDNRVKSVRISIEKHVPTPGISEVNTGAFFLPCQAVLDLLGKQYGRPPDRATAKTSTWTGSGAELNVECFTPKGGSLPLAHLITINRLN